MDREDFVNIMFSIVSLALAVTAIASAEYRIVVGMTAGFMLLGAIQWQNYSEIDILITENERLWERLDIQQQHADIKAELCYLRKGRK